MQRIITLRVRLIEVRVPIDVTLDLIQVADSDGPMEIHSRSCRLTTGNEQEHGQAERHEHWTGHDGKRRS
jgi:hypothetical protein